MWGSVAVAATRSVPIRAVMSNDIFLPLAPTPSMRKTYLPARICDGSVILLLNWPALLTVDDLMMSPVVAFARTMLQVTEEPGAKPLPVIVVVLSVDK